MLKVMFYGLNTQTLSLAEGLVFAFPKCSIAFPGVSEEQNTLPLPKNFSVSIKGNPELFFEDVDFVIIDQPLSQAKETLSYLRKYLTDKTFVISLSAVKTDMAELMKTHLAHICPFANAFAFAEFTPGLVRGDAFLNKIIAVICDNQPKTLETLRNFWNYLGAKIIPTSAEFFDEITANTVVGGLLASTMYLHILQRDSWADTLFFGFYDKSLRQSTNCVSKNPIQDTENILRNKDNILQVLSFFKREIHSLERLLNEENKEKLAQYFALVKKFQDRI